MAVATEEDALLASRSNAHSRRPSLLSMLAVSVSLSIAVPSHLSCWCPVEEHPEVDPISQLWLSLHREVIVAPVLLLRIVWSLPGTSVLKDVRTPPYGWNAVTASRLRLAQGTVVDGGWYC